MTDFTPTQGRYLSFIHAYTEGFNVPPAESEIAAAIGVSAPSVNQMMKTLEKKQLIRRQPGVARSLDRNLDRQRRDPQVDRQKDHSHCQGMVPNTPADSPGAVIGR